MLRQGYGPAEEENEKGVELQDRGPLADARDHAPHVVGGPALARTVPAGAGESPEAFEVGAERGAGGPVPGVHDFVGPNEEILGTVRPDVEPVVAWDSIGREHLRML